jgi:hypothetical protein
MGGFFVKNMLTRFMELCFYMHPAYKQWYNEKADNIGYHIVNMNPTFTKNNSIF